MTTSNDKKDSADKLESVLNLCDIKLRTTSGKFLNSPVYGQLTTASWKVCVYITPKYVYKGPFRANDRGLSMAIIYTRLMELFEDSLSLEEKYRTSLPIKIVVLDNMYYIKMKNVGDHKLLRTVQKSSKLQDNVSVQETGSMVKRFNDLSPGSISPDQYQALIQHIYFRYISLMGDSGMWNVLVRNDSNPRLLVGIDYEQFRSGHDRSKGKFGLLFAKMPAKQYHQSIETAMANIQTFKKIPDTILEFIDSIQNLGYDYPNSDKMQKLIDDWYNI